MESVDRLDRKVKPKAVGIVFDPVPRKVMPTVQDLQRLKVQEPHANDLSVRREVSWIKIMRKK